MRFYLFLFLAGGAVATGVMYSVLHGRLDTAYAAVSTLEKEISHKESALLGYTKYTSYLTLGQQSLAEHMKLLAATVTREESVTQVVERSLLGIASTGAVVIFYKAEYAFGFDLQASDYAVRATDSGIEISVKKPVLVAAPAVTQLRYQVLSGGLFTDEKSAVLRLYEEAARQAQRQGETMAADPAVIALCEKRLIAFLHDFLAKQPGVKVIPQITVAYH